MKACAAAAVLLALALRLLHVAWVADFATVHVVPGLDRWLEMEIARAVAGGDPLGGPLAPYESAPAYALLLGALYRLAGERWLGPLVVQALLGALTPLLLLAAGRRLGASRAGVLAALLAAVYAPAIFYEGLTIKFGLVPVTVAGLLWATAAAASGARWHVAAVVAGVLAALLVALRLNALAVVPVVVAWIAWSRGRVQAAPALLLFAAGLIMVAGPLAVRRSLAAARGEAASLWGIHFYVGTRLDGDGGYAVVPGIADDVFGHVDDARALAEAGSRRRLTPGEVSAYWFRRGLDDVRRQPGGYLLLEGRKLLRLLAAGEDDAFGDDYAAYASRSPVLRAGLTFGALAPLAAVGLVLVVVRRSPLGWCVAMVAAYAGSLLVFFVTARYRVPLVPPLLLLAGAALAWLADLCRRRPAVGVAAAVALVGGPALLGTPPADLARLLVVVVAAVPLAAMVRAPDGQGVT